MKKDRLSFLAGFLPALSMAALLLWRRLGEEAAPKMAVAAEAAAFGLPFLILLLLRGFCRQPSPLRLRPFRRQTLPLVLFTGVTVSLLSVLLNYGVVLLGGTYTAASDSLKGSFGALFLAVALAPALLEELFFRAGLLGAEEGAGTGPAILLSALCFALVHGTLSSLPATLAAGLAYGWLCYSLNSVWAAVLAHLVNNAISLLFAYGANVSAELGIWPYFLLAALFCFCLFLSLTLRTLENQLDRGKIPRFRRADFAGALERLLVSPGIWVLALLFVYKVFYL